MSPKNFLQFIRTHPLFPWAMVFLVSCFLIIEDGGTNARARFATLRAMSSDFTFRIDKQVDWTMDWAQTPDGAYYANKPPGPMLLGYPLFLILDRTEFIKGELKSLLTGSPYRHDPDARVNSWQILPIVFALQVIPFILLSLFWYSGISANAQISVAAREWGALALFFGSTAAILMNSFLGHPLAAVFLLWMGLAIVYRKLGMASFAFGFALLSDYGVAFLVPGLVAALALYWRKQKISNAQVVKDVRSIFIGALLPGAFWVWYHLVCFGGIFSLPMKFQNPAHLDQTTVDSSFWGAFSIFPDPIVFIKLLFGSERGILFTQPWLFVVVWGIFKNWRKDFFERYQILALFAVVGLLGLLFMNAGFNGWHGGGSPGPRYLSAIIPLFAVLIFVLFEQFERIERLLLIAGIAASVLLRALIYPDGILPPVEPIWTRYGSRLVAGETGKGAIFFFLFLGLLAVGAIWSRRHNFNKDE